MRQVKSEQRLRSHPCLVETLEVTGKDAPASVELYTLGRQAKFHVIVQQLCEVSPCRGQYIVQPHTLCACATVACTGRRPVPVHLDAPAFLRAASQALLRTTHRGHLGDARALTFPRRSEDGEFDDKQGSRDWRVLVARGRLRAHEGSSGRRERVRQQRGPSARAARTVLWHGESVRLLCCPPTSLGCAAQLCKPWPVSIRSLCFSCHPSC